MKISLQLEADSADEFRAFFAAFQTAPVPSPITETPVTVRVLAAKGWKAAQEPKPDTKPVEPEKAEPKTEPYDPTTQPYDAPQPAAAEAPVKAKRGRPAKAKPPEEGLTVIPGAEVPVSAPAPVPAAPAPSGNGTGAVTRQDLLDVFAEYVQRYGANFGYTDISGLLQKHLGEGVRKASDVAEAQLGQAIAAIKAAIVDNPFNRNRNYA